MKIIVCGSMSSSKDMVRVEEELKKNGHDVVLPKFTHEYAKLESVDKEITESLREKKEYDLIRGYFKKIKEGDSLLVVNAYKNGIEGYIGGNSFLEMGFAYVSEKPIYLLNKVPDMAYTDEILAMNPIVLDGDLSQIGSF